MKSKNYYFAVTNDKFEFPISPICRTSKELANWLNICDGTLRRYLSKNVIYKKLNCKFVKCKRLEDKLNPCDMQITLKFKSR